MISEVEKAKTGELGFEPRQTAPEAVVLPLHYSPRKKNPTTVIKCRFFIDIILQNPRATINSQADNIQALLAKMGKIIKYQTHKQLS